MKAMNKRLRCTGDNKERRYFTEPSEVGRTMIVGDVPQVSRRRYLTQQEAVRRYELREDLREGVYGRNLFRECAVSRPSKRKVQNRASKEAAGTQGAITMGIRTGAYSVCVCKTQNKW
jgi:hypothetical protein